MQNQKKPISIAIACDPITDYTAGVFVSTLRFAHLLRAAGHRIVFIAAKSAANPKDGVFEGIKVYRFRSVLLPKTEGAFRIAFPTVGEIQSILEKESIDVMHTMLPTPMTHFAIRAAKTMGIPCVVHSHAQPENIFLHIPRWLGRTVLTKIFMGYLRWVYRGADALVYPTAFAQSLFPELNKTTQNLVISNGVDASVFTPKDSQQFLKKNHFTTTTKNVLFVGRLHPEKNIETLLRSFPLLLQRTPDARLWIVGSGHQREALEHLAQQLNITQCTTFLGKVSVDDLVLAYNACDVFVLPSLAELEGLVILEAMACGKPIIVADAPTSASGKFVEKNGFLFCSENPEDLADKLHTILSNDDLRQRMGAQSLALSRTYDIRTSVKKLESLYGELLEK